MRVSGLYSGEASSTTGWPSAAPPLLTTVIVDGTSAPSASASALGVVST